MMKNIIHLVATIIILLFSIDFVSPYLIPESNIELCCDCPDLSKHSGPSHNHAFEDEVFYSESYSSQNKPDVSIDNILIHNLLFTDIYCSKVWQPPKIS